MKFIAYCTKGLEDIAQTEIVREIPGATILKRSTKRIIFETDADYDILTTLKTVDDLAIYIGQYDLSGIAKLNSVVEKLAEINLPEVYDMLSKYRKIKLNLFSLTIGLLNYKKFLRDELKDALAKRLSEKYSSEYSPMEHTNCDVRINIENNIAWVGIKLTPDSLFNRSYRVNPLMGSLKSTIAASMLNLASNNKANLKIVDNYCGSGTFLCEAVLKGHTVYGGDINESAIRATTENLAALKYDTTDKIVLQDGALTKWDDKSFDCAISNLPWGKQIEITSITELYEGCIKEYARIIKEGGTICLILTKPDLMKSLALRYIPNAQIKELAIGFLGQRPTIMVIKL